MARYEKVADERSRFASCVPAICTSGYTDTAPQPVMSARRAAAAAAGANLQIQNVNFDMLPMDLESIKRNPYKAASSLIEVIFVLCHNAYAYYIQISAKLEPWRLGLLNQAFFGLILCFFGGSYMTLIAAVEAYRMCGYEEQIKLVNELIEDFNVFVEASRLDDTVNPTGNTMTQADMQVLAQRKALLFFKTIDPQRFSEVIGGLQSGFFAVIATLKFKFAQAITVGTVMFQMIKKPTDLYVVPLVESRLPNDYKRWASVSLGWVIKAFTIYLAFYVQRIISAYYAALRGGLMFGRGVLHYASKMGFFSIDPDESIIDEVIGYSVAALGLYWQLSEGFSVPFPLNILLLPASICEYYLLWMVNTP